MEGDYSNQTSNNLEVNQPLDTSLTQTFDNFGANQTSNLNVGNNDNNNNDNNNASQSDFLQTMPGDLVQNDTFGEVGKEVKVHNKRKKMSHKAIMFCVIFIVLGLVILGLIGLVVYYWQKSEQSQQALTCKAGSGATCDVAGNSYSCMPIMGPNTQVVDNTIQPSQTVCPSGCTLGSNFVCDCTSPVCPKLEPDPDVVQKTNDQGTIITFSVDSTTVCNPTNNVTWDGTHSTCKSASLISSCTQCIDTTKNVPSVSDPATWVTCNDEKCEGSLTMSVDKSCAKATLSGLANASGAKDTAGKDFAGMFDCINNSGPRCQFSGPGSHFTTSNCPGPDHVCPAFSMNSSDTQIQYQACMDTSTSPTTALGSVVIAPFGNVLPQVQTSGLAHKLPGW